jgi:hypothetical protein
MRSLLSSRAVVALALSCLAACGSLPGAPDKHGPEWIERPVDTLTDALGQPDRRVKLPYPSLATVYLYTGGAQPGFAICERDYVVRGQTVIGYSERGTAPGCNRVAGRLE